VERLLQVLWKNYWKAWERLALLTHSTHIVEIGISMRFFTNIVLVEDGVASLRGEAFHLYFLLFL
jgi:hypothetical protein